ncbi:MAG TPA: hypothetical protein VKU85_03240, partial [bacterium]|nr:hypothetical protein [bacterium]
PFADAGALFERQRPDGSVVSPDRPEWLFAVGVGLQYNAFGIPGGAGQVRLDVARRLDRADDTVTYRMGFTLER